MIIPMSGDNSKDQGQAKALGLPLISAAGQRPRINN